MLPFYFGFYYCEETSWQDNSYKGRQLHGTHLESQRFSPLSLEQESWLPAGRLGAGEAAESSVSIFICRQTGTIFHFGQSLMSLYKTWKATSMWYIYSNKATPTPVRLHLLMMLFPMANAFKHTNKSMGVGGGKTFSNQQCLTYNQ